MSEYNEGAVHDWFGLSYAGWLTLPRVILQEMPGQWQRRFVGCLEELEDAFESMGCDDVDIEVQFKRNGKYVSAPPNVCQYRRPDRDWLESLKRKGEKAAVVAGE